jgi:hypothetical protein
MVMVMVGVSVLRMLPTPPAGVQRCSAREDLVAPYATLEHVRAVGTHYWPTRMLRACTATPSEGHTAGTRRLNHPRNYRRTASLSVTMTGRAELLEDGTRRHRRRAARLVRVYCCWPDGAAGERGRRDPASSRSNDRETVTETFWERANALVRCTGLES